MKSCFLLTGICQLRLTKSGAPVPEMTELMDIPSGRISEPTNTIIFVDEEFEARKHLISIIEHFADVPVVPEREESCTVERVRNVAIPAVMLSGLVFAVFLIVWIIVKFQ